jgi:hypothetical protein
LNPSVKGKTDFVSIRGEKVPLAGATATMEVFDAFGKSLDSVTAIDSAAGLTLSISAPGIHSVILTQDSANAMYDGTIGFDDLQFDPVSAVPLPPSVLMLGTGLIGSLMVTKGRKTFIKGG